MDYLSKTAMETYYGHVKSPADAIVLFEACRNGTLPRVQRRLSEKERKEIRSGSVFVWDEREAGMRRWTDGKSWSASRVSGSFLTYREMEGKRGGSNVNSPAIGNAAQGPHLDPDQPPDGYRYKPDGLVKQSFSITTNHGHHLHLISYYARSHPAAASLPSPTTDPALRHVRPEKGMYPDSSVNDVQNMPAITQSPMGESPYQTTPYGYNAPSHLRHPPPQYGWPPSPHNTPPGMYSHYGPGYFPPGFAPPAPPVAAAAANGNGVPFWHPAMYGQHAPPGPTAFDRMPPPVRGVPPPPPPAPSHSYPQHSAQGPQSPQDGPSPPTHGERTPPYIHSSTYQAQHNARADRHQASNGGGVNPPRPEERASFSRNRLDTKPPFFRHSSISSTNGQSEGVQMIPSINSLLNNSSPPPRFSQPAPPVQEPTRTAPERKPSDAPGQDASAAAAAKAQGGHNPGYGEDMNALRRLDRAFAP